MEDTVLVLVLVLVVVSALVWPRSRALRDRVNACFGVSMSIAYLVS